MKNKRSDVRNLLSWTWYLLSGLVLVFEKHQNGSITFYLLFCFLHTGTNESEWSLIRTALIYLCETNKEEEEENKSALFSSWSCCYRGICSDWLASCPPECMLCQSVTMNCLCLSAWRGRGGGGGQKRNSLTIESHQNQFSKALTSENQSAPPSPQTHTHTHSHRESPHQWIQCQGGRARLDHITLPMQTLHQGHRGSTLRRWGQRSRWM